MKKPNITEGEWLIDDWNGQLQIETENIVICKIQTRNRYKAEQDARAIVTAINNTYRKGIDPEIIDDMIDALIKCWKLMNRLNVTVRETDAFKSTKQALSKAGVDINETGDSQ